MTLFSVAIAAAVFFLSEEKPSTIAESDGPVVPNEWLTKNKNPVTPEQYRRSADQTFLTFPEWFLVFSPEEQAAYFKNHTSTTFPFMSHTAQIWDSYRIVNKEIENRFEYNGGYHFMIWVIGCSATAEYSVKSLYEILVGRITDTKVVMTAEDRFNAKFTQDYVDFIKVRPWYEFDFKSQLSDLWKSTPLFGKHLLRKLERRYILTSELMVKYAYGKIIGLGTASVYEEALPATEVLIKNLPENGFYKILKEFPQGKLLSIQRYDGFKNAANELVFKGANFIEIAGNRTAILLTIIVPAENQINIDNTKIIFTQPVTSATERKRVALVVKVENLSSVLKELKRKNIFIEHIFDY
jgi:hypothetical protein